MVTISPDGKITDVNQATVKVTGVPRDKLLGTDFSVYFTDPEKAEEVYQRVLSQGPVTDYPLTLRHRDGQETHWPMRLAYDRSADGLLRRRFRPASR
jgi:PAS domain S-box-containing protein